MADIIKKMKILYLNYINIETHRLWVQQLTDSLHRELLEINAYENRFDLSAIDSFCDENSVDMIFVSCRNQRSTVQQLLDNFRTLRLPYCFLTDTMRHLRPIQTILLPVSMLEEEVHKTELTQHLVRFTGTNVVILQANDYGSHAEKNVEKILTALKQREIEPKIHKAKKDSFRLNKEAAECASEYSADALILTASREYGLDDLLFGPQERHAIMRAYCPVFLLNPRADLYSLCD